MWYRVLDALWTLCVGRPYSTEALEREIRRARQLNAETADILDKLGAAIARQARQRKRETARALEEAGTEGPPAPAQPQFDLLPDSRDRKAAVRRRLAARRGLRVAGDATPAPGQPPWPAGAQPVPAASSEDLEDEPEEEEPNE